MTDHHALQGRVFGTVAAAYHRGRPTYPLEAAAWLTGDRPLTVLELGAGTGKLTRQLVALGHDVHATDPDPRMLEVLRQELPQVRCTVAAAEELPVADAAYDVVVSAQAFHWFDLDRALPETARVLRPGGRLALVWNERDERIPWVRRLGRLIGSGDHLGDPTEALATSGHFGFVEHTELTQWQGVDRLSVQDLVASRSHVAALDEEARAAKLAEVVALYDEYGRGMDGMQLPYVVRCYRTTVVDDRRPAGRAEQAEQADAERPEAERTDAEQADSERPDRERIAEAGAAVPASDGTDTDLLLIDFR